MLTERLEWTAHYETSEVNPYINDFYCNMQRWSFNLQISFLYSRFKQIVDIRSGKENVIQDRSIYEDASIFAPNLHSMGLLDSRDFQTYTDLFQLSASFVPPPDLLIYIKASVKTLVQQIANRGRIYEKSINRDYLKNLNYRYDAWIKSYNLGKVLVIDIDKVNFLTSQDCFETVLKQVTEMLGLPYTPPPPEKKKIKK